MVRGQTGALKHVHEFFEASQVQMWRPMSLLEPGRLGACLNPTESGRKDSALREVTQFPPHSLILTSGPQASVTHKKAAARLRGGWVTQKSPWAQLAALLLDGHTCHWHLLPFVLTLDGSITTLTAYSSPLPLHAHLPSHTPIFPLLWITISHSPPLPR